MWMQPRILRRGARMGLLRWAAALFASRPGPPVPILAIAGPRRTQKILDDVAALLRKTW